MINLKNPLVLVGKNYVYLITDQGFTEVKNIKDLKNRIDDSKIKLITGHDTSHYHLIEFKKEELVDKKKIKIELQNKIPSDLDKITWTYKDTDRDKRTNIYWTFAIEDKLVNPFLKTVIENGLTINQISFFPFLVAKSITKPKKPTLLIFLKNKVQFLAYIWEDRVLTYGLQNLDTLKDDISNFLNLIKIKYDLEVKDIISISDRDLSSLKIKMESVNLNLKNLEFTSLISDFKYQERKEIKKEEADEIKGKENQSTEDKTEKTDSNLPKLLLLLVASILLMGIVFLPKILGDKEAPPSEIIEETSVATLTPTPLPSPSPQFFPNLYSVQVLNGTNIGGLATTTKELLEENGYEDVEIGNAPEDYVLTEIITDNDEELIKNLSEILSLDFEINSTPSSTTSLSPDLDAIVILGNKK